MTLNRWKVLACTLTIGVGHIGSDVYIGQKISQQRADDLFAVDLGHAEQAVSALVRVPLSDNQFAVLVDFVFNCGVSAFQKRLPD